MAASLTLMEAYMVETLLAAGMTKSELVHAIKTADIDAILEKDDSFDYLKFIQEVKDNPERIEQAILSGYRIKFMSVYGIERILNIKFNLESGKDYTLEEHRFLGIELSPDGFASFENMLSPNWVITNKKENDSNITFDIVHKTQS